MLRQDRDLAGDQRQFAIAGLAEDEPDGAFAHLLGPDDAPVIEPVEGLALALQGVEREDHVIDGDRLAIVPARLGPQGEGDPGPVLGPFDSFGDQPVLGERLVLAGDGEALRIDAGGGIAADDVGVERIEGAGDAEAHQPPLRGVRIDVVEMAEVGPYFGSPNMAMA